LAGAGAALPPERLGVLVAFSEPDAADQLRRIDYHDGSATVFKYDAMGRRVRIVEWDNADPPVETSNKYFLWDGLSIVEERNGGTPTTVTSSYFAEGEVRSGTKYIYGRDHLGSVREVVDVSATTDTVVARYDYDPYGRREVVSETVAFDWGFTGHYYHAESDLHLAPFRAYDADLGRWLSRDSLGEAGGINLYEYALSNPVNFVDPLGLSVADFLAGFAHGYSGGLSSAVLGALGVDGINKCSTAFNAGGWIGFGASLATMGGVGAVGIVAGKVLLKGGLKKLLAGGGARTNAELIQAIATRADAWGARQGLGRGSTAGTLKHSYADELLTRYQRRFGDRGLSTEVPYLNGTAGQRGRGSIRLDVVEGPLDNPTAIFDYKFGGATLTPKRIQQIRQVGQFGPNVPIIGVHP
jgi:RHS repeat-associated protein